MFAYFGVPGPLEMLILLGLFCLAVVGGIVALVFILYVTKISRPPANPNLYSCPDCGRHVSRKAEVCPNCGRPLAGPTTPS